MVCFCYCFWNYSISSKNANYFELIFPHQNFPFTLSPIYPSPYSIFIRKIHNSHLIRFMYGGCSSSGGFRGEPCTIQCVLAMGTIPQLQCKKCLCLFHQECVGFHNFKGSVNHYICDVSNWYCIFVKSYTVQLLFFFLFLVETHRIVFKNWKH